MGHRPISRWGTSLIAHSVVVPCPNGLNPVGASRLNVSSHLHEDDVPEIGLWVPSDYAIRSSGGASSLGTADRSPRSLATPDGGSCVPVLEALCQPTLLILVISN